MRTKMVNGQVIELTAEENTERDLVEQAWADGEFERIITGLRTDRNRLLAETDYYALDDVVLSAELRKYRQELRDLPNGLSNAEQVKSVVWPIKPM